MKRWRGTESGRKGKKAMGIDRTHWGGIESGGER